MVAASPMTSMFSNSLQIGNRSAFKLIFIGSVPIELSVGATVKSDSGQPMKLLLFNTESDLVVKNLEMKIQLSLEGTDGFHELLMDSVELESNGIAVLPADLAIPAAMNGGYAGTFFQLKARVVENATIEPALSNEFYILDCEEIQVIPENGISSIKSY